MASITMKLIALVASIAAVNAGVIQEPKECNGVTVNDVYHEKEVLKTEVDRPYLLAVDYSTNTLYFSYSLDKEIDVFQTSYINLNSKEFGNIEGVPNGFAQAVDDKSHDIYIGAHDGIYKYDHNRKVAELFAAKATNIWALHFKDVLYFSTFPGQFLYTVIDGEVERFKDLEDTKVDHFIIDNENEMFFTNESGLFGQKKGTKDAVLYKEKLSIRGLTTDINGTPYVAAYDGIYVIDRKEKKLDKVADIDDVFGLSFDNDNNIVYSDATSLIRLKPGEVKDCKVIDNIEVDVKENAESDN